MVPAGSARPPLVVVSNRGPTRPPSRGAEGEISTAPTRAGGGLVATLGPALVDTGAVWFAAQSVEGAPSLTSGPLRVTHDPVDAVGIETRRLEISADDYRAYYDVIANGTLWFLHHNLFDLARRPSIDNQWWEAWHTYCAVNEMFASTVAESAPEGATVLVHDYHLTLLGKALAKTRPDLRTMHFHHTPFMGRNTSAVLPPDALRALLEGLGGHRACGFHSQRWADNFSLCCADTLGRVPTTLVSAAAPDVDELRSIAASTAGSIAANEVDELVGDRKLIVRVDRIELSKNLLRGFEAYDDLLRRHAEWRGAVTFAAFLNPSRESMAEYLDYRHEVESLVEKINSEWSTSQWQPVVLRMRDDFPQSVAALRRYDVLLVNPVRDGLNLVAKEGAVVNERNGVIVLSREAGSWQELREGAIGINPFDIVGMSDALLQALSMGDEERAERAEQVREASTKRRPHDWLEDQIRVANA